MENVISENEKQVEEDRSIFSQILERIIQGYSIKLEDSKEESDKSLETLLDGTPDSVLILSPNAEILRANNSFFLSFGYDKPEIYGKLLYRFLPEEFRETFRAKLRELHENSMEPKLPSQDDIMAFHGLKADGSILNSYCLLSGIQFNGHSAYIALIRDLGFEKSLFQNQRSAKELYTALTEALNETILWLDRDFNIIFANSGIKTTFGWEREEVLGRPFSILFPPAVYENKKELFERYRFIDDQDRKNFGLKHVIEFLGLTKQRGIASMEMSFGSSKERDGRILSCVIRDTTYRKTLERRMKHLAFHDKLTGLGNRDLYNEEVSAFFKDKLIDQLQLAAVMYIDLDSFKNINDPLGHNIGDEILVETAKRLRMSLRDGDSAYRFGSDEFVIFLPFLKAREDAITVAKRILFSIAQPYIMQNKNYEELISLTVSIGIAIIPEHGNCVEEVTKNADIAMYNSKESGKNRYTLYNIEISNKAITKWNLEQEIKQALNEGSFHLVYQPIVNTMGQIRGFETLARWTKKDKSQVPPSVFIPIAEESGVIAELSDWVLRRACYDMRRLKEKGAVGLYVSVNVSSRQFMQPAYPKKLESIVKASELPPSWLKLELTETTIMSDSEGAIKRILDIKKRLPGISFMIDDFGTGYSSLAYLARLPVDFLKVDISFVSKLSEKQNEKVVKAILNLGKSLDLGIVVEGIETRMQNDYFIAYNDVEMQGYYHYKPLSYDELDKTLSNIRSLAGKAKAKRGSIPEEKHGSIAAGSLAAKAAYLHQSGILHPLVQTLNP